MVDTRNRQDDYIMVFGCYYKLGYQLHMELLKNKIKHSYFRNSKQDDVLKFLTKDDLEKAYEIYKINILKEER